MLPRLLVVVPLLVFPGLALAQVDTEVARLGRRLASGKDPRIRAEAARGLGASEDAEAVPPLCAGLEDPSETVRAEAARGLGALQEVAALDCLRARRRERDAGVAAAIRESVRAIEAFKARAPRLYVAFDGVRDRTGTLTPELVRFTEQRLVRGLVQRGAQLAPRGETQAAANGVLQKRRLSGYHLLVEVHPTDGGGLQLTVVCLRYPSRALLGQVEVRAAGATPVELLKALAPRAVEEAADTFSWRR
ncbi:HEAT repeat domain-containing protein [Myxococcaceae bacterium GXIMD 01537]